MEVYPYENPSSGRGDHAPTNQIQGEHKVRPYEFSNILFILSILVNKKGGSRTAPTNSGNFRY